VSLAPFGSDIVSDMMTVWPENTATGGISFLAADLGSVGTLVVLDGLGSAESVHSVEMGNWLGERFGYLN